MTNVIQIKRSIANATVTGLNPGELAYTQASNTLWIGLPDPNAGVIRIAGAQYPGVLTANQALVANSSSAIDKVIVANLVATSLFANGSFGTANQVLKSNGSIIYWTDDVGDISSITAGNGLTGGGSTGDITLNVGQGNGISVSADSIRVQQANGIIVDAGGVSVAPGTGVTVNATGVHIGQNVSTTSNVTFANVVTTDLTVNGNTIIGSNTSDSFVVNALYYSNAIPSANLTYHLGNTTNRWSQVHAGNVHAVTGTFDSNVYVAGDLIVVGNVTTINVNSVVVSDPMIYLAGNNYSSDLVDIGLAANYFDGTQRHTGLFRDHVDGIWKLFTNLTQELSGNNDVDTSDPSYRIAVLQTYLESSGLLTNSSSVNITANSSVSVSIVANTLTLSTALAATSGGTGLNSYNNQDILVASNTTHLAKLALGGSGYVLQSNGTALSYDTLDGGLF